MQNFKIDQALTFLSVLLLSCEPKTAFGDQYRQETTKDGTPKWEAQLVAAFQQEARLWTLLVRHTAEPVHRRAATDAQCAARARAREYAEFAQHWPVIDAEATTDRTEHTP